jgi:hypothetical protein
MYRAQFGDVFIDYFLMMKREELTRSQEETAGAKDQDAASKDWEMKEYFEFF